MHLYRPIIASLVIIFAVNQQAHASSDNLDSDMDNGIEGFQQGNSEGISAGIAIRIEIVIVQWGVQPLIV